jgi:hypothetical protein
MKDMEKFSSFNRIIAPGNTEEDKKVFLEQIGEDFKTLSKEKIPGESIKSLEEIQICERLNDLTNQLSELYGGAVLEIDDDQVHIFDPKTVSVKDEEVGGYYDPTKQVIVLDRSISDVATAHKIGHEMIHKKSYGAMQVTTEGVVSSHYRLGFQMESRDGAEEYFRAIEEALTEELTISLMEILDQEHTIKVNKDPEIVRRKNFDPREVQETYPNGILLSFSYKEERDALRMLINKIIQKNKKISYVDVFEMFCKGKFSGNVLSISKLIDQSFGKGTFRKLGEATSGKADIFTQFVEGL